MSVSGPRSGVQAVVGAVRAHQERQDARLSRYPRYGTVVATGPLAVNLLDSDVTLQDDDLVIGGAVRTYDAQTGISVGDAVLLHEMPDHEFYVADVTPATANPDLTSLSGPVGPTGPTGPTGPPGPPGPQGASAPSVGGIIAITWDGVSNVVSGSTAHSLGVVPQVMLQAYGAHYLNMLVSARTTTSFAWQVSNAGSPPPAGHLDDVGWVATAV